MSVPLPRLNRRCAHPRGSRAALALLAFALIFPLTARTATFSRLLTEQSAITFTYQQMGVKMDGKFGQFTARMEFDPAKPAAAKAEVDVAVSSIDTGYAEGNSEVVGKTWFNAKAFPVARFVLSSLRAQGGNRYQIAGKLTIKGATRDLVFPATFTAQGGSAVFDGAFILHRADFAIGEGEWASFDTVANDIQVRLHLVAASH